MKKKERKNAGRKRAVTALKHSKRMLSVLLIFMMLITMMPASSMTYADEQPPASSAPAQNNDPEPTEEENASTPESVSTEESASTPESVSTEESASTEESVSTEESASTQESVSTQESASTPESVSTEPGASTQASVSTPESPQTQESTSAQDSVSVTETGESSSVPDKETGTQATVTAAAFYGEQSLTVHWADNGNEAGERPDPKTYPVPALSFSVDGAEPAELTADNLGEVGLSDMPEITVSGSGDSYTITVPGDTLPSSVKDSRSGDEITRPVEWDMDLKEIGNYSLTEIKDPENYWYATAGAGWYYVLDGLEKPYEAGWEVLSFEEADSSPVYWADDANRAQLRPTTEEYPALELYFARTSADQEDWEPAQEEYRKLEEGTLKEAFLESMPSIEVTAADENSFTVTTPGETLPSSVKETGENGEETTWILKWEIVLPQVEHYRLTEVTEEQAGKGEYAFAENGAGWYYVLEEGGREESRVLAWEEASRQKVYWADGGDASGIRPEPEEFGQPVLRFAVTVQGGEGTDFVELTADNLEEVCLEKTPVIEVTQEGDSFVLSHDGETFPSEILFAKADGTEEVRTVEWEMLLPEVEGYTLTEVTESEMEAEAYSWADQGAGWYYVLDSEEGVRIDGYSDNLEVQVFWVEEKDSEGGMSPDSEDYPEPELTFLVEEGTAPDEEPADGEDESAVTAEGSGEETLTEDNMEQLGLSGLPEVQINREQQAVRRMSRMAAGAAGGREDEPSYSVERYRIRVDGESLPSCVTKTEAGGEETSFFVSWTMKLQEVEGYRLMEVTEEMINANPELYFFAAGNGAGMYYVSERVGQESIKVTGWENDLTRTVIWVDNNSEGGIRPDSSAFLPRVKIEFAVSEKGPGGDITDITDDETKLPEGLTWKTLGEETIGEIGLDKVPGLQISGKGTGSWTLSFAKGSLPQEFTWTDAAGKETTKYVYWRITPPAADSEAVTGKQGKYSLTDTDNPPQYESGYPVPKEKNRWYYVEQTDFSFEIDIRWGNLGAAQGITEAILKKFFFTAQFPDEDGGDQEVTSTLEKIRTLLQFDDIASPDPNNPNKGTVTIQGLPKYYYDGTTVSYWLGTGKEDKEPEKLEVDELGEDYFAVRFDNTDTAIVGNETEEVYSGGKLILTLTGTKQYQAKKVWLDEADSGNRPEVEFHLWRYRAGSDPSTAAPVAGDDGKNLVFTPETTEGNHFLIQFTDSEEKPIDLPKYDAEGYEYIYVVREIMTGSGYEQVLGEVGEDGTVTDFIYKVGDDGKLTLDPNGRTAGNDFVYNGGTISNRLSDTVSSTVVKTWNAAAFQTGFEGVSVELTLQSRKKDSPADTPWNDTDITVTMDGFYAEHMTHSNTVNPPKYGAQGEELEYQWVESAVYQGDKSVNLLKEDETFTLVQNGEEVTYRSEQEVAPVTGETIITNGIADTIQYDAKKIWIDETGKDISLEKTGTEVTFALYRAISGEEPDYTTPCFTFMMDGIVDDSPTPGTDSEGNPVTVQETDPWEASVIGLPEYNEEGLLYEYFLLEIASTDTTFYPIYKTERTEDGGYLTTVTNGPGEGHIIIVQKYWTDSSDVTHREDVTLQVYAFKQEGTKPIAEVTLSAENGGSWNRIVGIGKYEPDEVYIVETKIGNAPTGYQTDTDGKPLPTIDRESGEMEQEAIHQFDGENHKYEATYQRTVTKDVANSTILSVTNRRLGEITIKVTKTWKDGDGAQRKKILQELEQLNKNSNSVPQLAFYLDFGPASPDDYEITHKVNGEDTIDIANLPVDITGSYKDETYGTVIPIDLTEEPNTTATYTFEGVPKYDSNGNTANYEVRESWVVEDGGTYRELTAEELREEYPTLYALYSEYRTSVTSDYEVGELHDQDTQTVTVTNSLSGTKTVNWNKRWRDNYTYGNNERPDLYLDLYQLKHVPDQEGDVKLTEYQKNYLWTQQADEPTTSWTATFSNLPKYDDYGYEIFYYAIERTEVNGEALGYEIPKYSMDDGTAVCDLGTANEPTEEAIRNQSVYPLSSDSEREGDLGEYALKEEGTFTNAISGETSALVRKKWTNLPTDYPSDDLPSVTFSLYQGLEEDSDEEIVAQKAYATLTVTSDQWKSLAKEGAYTFSFVYAGKNEIKIEGGSVVTVPGDLSAGADPATAKKLPKFDEEGRLYKYVLRETITVNNGDGAPGQNDVYGSPVISGYEVTNPYDSKKGSLAFRKYLKLPMNADNTAPEAYPAVEFEISRSYETNEGNGTMSEPEVISVTYNEGTGRWEKVSSGGRNLVWSSEKVKAAYEAQADAELKDPMVSSDFTVDGLEIYAPNGSKYVYTVTEVKDELQGYETWAVKEAVEKETIKTIKTEENKKNSAEGLKPVAEETTVSVSATFLNEREDTPTKISLTGKKVWNDFENVFSLRPNDLEVEVTRSAKAQDGQDNDIDPVTLTEDGDYTIQWDKDNNLSEWTYTITGKDNELEAYAPNGMPWDYVVTEKSTGLEGYTQEESTARETGTPDKNDVQQMTDLVNSISTSESFRKYWVDEDGNPIEEDYLGLELKVTFELQVREVQTGGKYTSASKYFSENLDTDVYNQIFPNYAFSQTLSGRIDASSGWSGTFSGLPQQIKKKDATEGELTALEYRVIETEIQYGTNGKIAISCNDTEGGESYTYTFTDNGLFYPYYKDNGGVSHSSENKDQYNQLKTTEFAVKKVWANDSENRYKTRPATAAEGYTWETSFLIQRSFDNSNWENVTVTENGEQVPFIVTLYGTDGESEKSLFLTGLPEAGVKEDGTTATLSYRAWELQPGYDPGNPDGSIVKNGGVYCDTYTAEYEEIASVVTVTNTMNTTQVQAEKQWKNNGPNKPNVSFTLQYKNAEGKWIDVSPKQTVVLDGKADTGSDATYGECAEWKAQWTGLPEVMPGSQLGNGKTQYQVVETPLNGYETTTTNDNGTTVITNQKVVSFSVEKIWKVAQGADQPAVTVGLWRESGNTIEMVSKDDHSQNCTAPEKQYTLTLNSGNGWKGTFEKLPEYPDGSNEKYTYFAREIKIGETPLTFKTEYPQKVLQVIADGKLYKVVHTDTPTPTPTKTTIYNIGQTELTVTKKWIDNSDAGNLRPEDIELILVRKEGSSTQKLKKDDLGAEGITLTGPVVNGTNSNQWTYTYSGLWVANKQGTSYTYSVEEGKSGLTLANGDEYVPFDSGTTITNTLTGKTEVTVTKTWADGGNADGFRGKITLELYADGMPKETVTLDRTGVVSQILNTFTDSGNRWSYTFEDLDKYDKNGKLIKYTVKETKAPDGYKQGTMEGDAQDGFEITNTLLTSVTVVKKWRGVSGGTYPEITIGLYRKAEGSSSAPEKVTDRDGNQLVAKLDETAGWTYTFADLPRFDADGQRYEYTVQEQLIGGKPAADSGFVIHTEGGMVADGTDKGAWSYTITNIGGTEISGTKTWKDNSNAYNTRPENLELTLWRKTAGGTEEVVKEEWLEADGSELIWTKQGDVWTYTFKGLPLTDDQGAIYTYRVQETVPAGYVSDPADGFAGEAENYSFTNTLTDWIKIPVVKIWEDNKDSSGKRPDSIEVILYANGKEYRRVTVGKDTNVLAHIWNRITGGTDDEWKFEFTNLPKYDADGALITYSIEEKVPEGYDGYYEAEDGLMKIVNLREGSLRVTKKVSGSAGDKGRRFHFTVKLEDTSINGTYGDMEFENGVAKIKLRHGESATASGLPAGIGYRVSEEDVSENGYTTWAENASGEIVLDGTVNVIFHNHRNLPEEDDEEEDPVVPVQPVKPAPPAGMPALPGMVIPETSAAPASAQTGDFANPALYAGLAVLASGTIAGILIGRKRRTKKNKKKRA